MTTIQDLRKHAGILVARLTLLALASACSPALRPAQVMSATADLSDATAIPQVDTASPEWSTYQDPSGRFSFQYPAHYDEPKYQEMGCGPQVSKNSLSLTPRIFLAWKPVGAKTLADHVADFIAATTEPGIVEITKEYSKIVGGVTGQEIEYRFGDAHRLGLATIVLHQDTVYRFEYTDSLECYVPEQPPTFLLDAYAQLIHSFQFIAGP